MPRFVHCFRDHQLSDWKGHKKQCKIIAADQAQADSHEIHKREFDRIRKKYGLDNPEKAGQIADLLANTDANEGVSAPKFAKMFGMSTEEAVVFLEWIKVSNYTTQSKVIVKKDVITTSLATLRQTAQVGIKFKEETLDTAKKAGLGGSS